MEWIDEFKNRMGAFDQGHPDRGSISVSFKVRVTGGCFHREHSPYAYHLIDEFLRSQNIREKRVSVIEHESGPEVLAYIALAAGVLNITASVVNLIAVIIKARSEGIKHGDRPDAPLELIIRGFGKDGNLQEEKVLTFHAHDKVDAKLIESALRQSFGAAVQDKLGKKKKASQKKHKNEI